MGEADGGWVVEGYEGGGGVGGVEFWWWVDGDSREGVCCLLC